MRLSAQNLNDLPGSTHREPVRGPMWQNGRAWLRFAKRVVNCEWSFKWFHSVSLHIEKHDDGDLSVSVTLPPMYLYLSVSGIFKYGEKRDLSVGVYFPEWTLRWVSWMDDYSWSSRTPKWRQGSFDIPDLLLGRQTYTTRTLDERQVTVPMPERAYRAKATLFLSTWKRPRWFAKHMVRVTIDMEKGEGLPKQGKGENSWDCGPDATHGITCKARSIPEGVGVLVGSVLKDRVKYGGWGDWAWPKAEKAA